MEAKLATESNTSEHTISSSLTRTNDFYSEVHTETEWVDMTTSLRAVVIKLFRANVMTAHC